MNNKYLNLILDILGILSEAASTCYNNKIFDLPLSNNFNVNKAFISLSVHIHEDLRQED